MSDVKFWNPSTRQVKPSNANMDGGMNRGDDDYFSSDLPDERVAEIWGRVKQPILVVPSAKDQFVPPTVDFEKLLAKWKSFGPAISELSGLIPDANHTVDPPSSREWLADRVVRFLRGLDK